jgi:hypothetical protein
MQFRFLRAGSRTVIAVTSLVLLLIVFQNCSSQFEPLTQQLSSTGQSGGPSVTALPPVPTSVTLSENPASSELAPAAVEGVQAGQIFQRKENDQATIMLKVKTALAADLLYASISLLNSAGTVEGTLLSGIRSGTTDFAFELATGMSARKVRLSFYNSKGFEQSRWTSPGFSVGEVFLVAGQSNSSTHGEAPTSSAFSLNRGVDPEKKAWVPMADPLPYATSWNSPPWNSQGTPGGSAWPGFADDLSARLQVPVAVISVGFGGSALSWWLPGSAENDFWRLVVGAQAVPFCGFRAVLWHQGESDSMGKFTATSYQSNFQKMVSSFRQATGCQQPWMIAQATWLHTKYWMQNYPSLSEADAIATKWAAEVEIRKGQKALGQSGNFLVGPDTDLLVAHRYRYDDLHFSTLGLPLHGRLWSQKVLKMLGKSYSKEPDLIPEVKTVWDAFQSALGRTTAEIESDPEGVRYWNERLSLGLITQVQLLETLRNSDEAFIRQVYTEVIGRRPSADELSGWLSKLASGAIANRNLLKDAIIKAK